MIILTYTGQGKGNRDGGENKFFNMPYFSVRKAEIPDFKQTWKIVSIV